MTVSRNMHLGVCLEVSNEVFQLKRHDFSGLMRLPFAMSVEALNEAIAKFGKPGHCPES